MQFPTEQQQAAHDLELMVLIMNAIETAGSQTEEELESLVRDYERTYLRYGIYRCAISGEAGVRWDPAANDLVIRRDQELVARLKEVIGRTRQTFSEEN